MNLQLEFGQTPIETIVIQPTPEMPLDVFRQLHRLGCYMEHMERLPDGRVLWDENLVAEYDESSADAEHLSIANRWFDVGLEIPKVMLDEMEASA